MLSTVSPNSEGNSQLEMRARVNDCSGSMKLTVLDDIVSKFERGKSY